MLSAKPVTLPPEEKQRLVPDPLGFLQSFKEHAADYIRNAYETEHTCYTSLDGTLTTSLAEDVLSLVETQRSVLRDFLNTNNLVATEAGNKIFTDGMFYVLKSLHECQMTHRLVFLTTLEDASAAANDFFRMSERMECFLRDLDRSDLATMETKATSTQAVERKSSPLRRLGESLVSQFSQDAVYAAERTTSFILRAVQQKTSISSDLFSRKWEDDWTHNEVVARLIKMFDDRLIDIRRYLSNVHNDYLYHKTLITSARAMICFYIRCLVHKADSIARHGKDILRKRDQPFRNPERALMRMMDDIGLMTDFFEEKTRGNTVLTRMIRTEVSTLEVIHECLGATSDATTLESFIVVLHKRTGADSLVTRYFVGDLCLLTLIDRKSHQSGLRDTLDSVQQDLHMVTTHMKERRPLKTDEEISFVRLDEMLKTLYEDRIAQGLLPICWTCLPKEFVQEGDEHVIARRIRNLTRNVVELRWPGRKKSS